MTVNSDDSQYSEDPKNETELDSTWEKAEVAANIARHLARNRGMPNTAIHAAEAAAIGTVIANKIDKIR